jgi:DNA-binding response OmpR family regulator
MASILIADDNPSHRALAQFVLESQGGHSVRAVDSAPALLEELASGDPDLLVLDVVMPGQTGLDLCRQLRRRDTLPILLVSGRSASEDVVIGLRSGADDYLAKPFDPSVLIERVNALLRRTSRSKAEPTGAVFRAGDIRLHLIDRSVWLRDRGPITLTPNECRLLFAMLCKPGVVWTREMILRRLWDSADYCGPTAAVESYISRLRQKLERNPRKPVYFATVRGFGYLLNVTAER